MNLFKETFGNKSYLLGISSGLLAVSIYILLLPYNLYTIQELFKTTLLVGMVFYGVWLQLFLNEEDYTEKMKEIKIKYLESSDRRLEWTR